jgi:multiple sugar transport system ATP-binding protein
MALRSGAIRQADEARGGSNPRIGFDRVWKLFDSKVAAVRDLTLEIQEGEFLVLVGPSGCGKTTSLRMLAGLERPSHGRIWMRGEDVTDVPPGKRDVAMVFQSYALYPHMTVYKNLSFGPRVRKEPRQDLGQRINDVADILGIRELLDRHPAALSGGQRQRVAVGRALIRQPQPALFLMDEPLSNLDAALRVQMRAELIRLHSRLDKTTTVYVTHDQVEALTMGDRVAVLNAGVLQQVDSPADLYEYPSSVFVAEFIGSPRMNLVPGVIESGAGPRSLAFMGELRFALPSGVSARLLAPASQDVIVGLRPHDLHIAGESAQDLVRFDAVVDVVEHTGTEIFATVLYQGTRLGARLPRSPVPQSGDRLSLAFNPDRLYLFDPETQLSMLARSAVPGAINIQASHHDRPVAEQE